MNDPIQEIRNLIDDYPDNGAKPGGENFSNRELQTFLNLNQNWMLAAADACDELKKLWQAERPGNRWGVVAAIIRRTVAIQEGGANVLSSH